MPDLPTITVTDEQAQRLLAAFGNTDNYREWLRRQLVAHVARYERATIDAKVEAFRRQKVEELGDEVLPEVSP